ncbi:MAG: hypothetical protein QM765_10960 [Myxococcales bacterium]
MNARFTAADQSAFAAQAKVAVIATKDPVGLPHLTLITSLQVLGDSKITLGQFCVGRSKQYLQERPEFGFAVMSLDRRLWRGAARWTGLRREGPEYEAYNLQAMFRYNSYFGINTVHYADLLELEGPRPVPVARIAVDYALTRALRALRRPRKPAPALGPFSRELLDAPSSIKFLGYVRADGTPVVVPVLQAQSAGTARIVLSAAAAFGDELKAVPSGASVAILAVTMQMQSVLVRGRFSGVRGLVLPSGQVEVDWVYNSMPPGHGQIYPPVPLQEVRDFGTPVARGGG